MSIEDINYLRKSSIKQSFTFLIDSRNRDRNIYPDPSYYVVDFTVPFKNVIGMEVIDVSIPKTMYNVDYNNNRLYYYLADSNDIEENKVTITYDDNGNEIYDTSKFSYVDIPPGDYVTSTFIDKFRSVLISKNIFPKLDMNGVDTPADLTNLIYFKSAKPFILDMHRSTIAELLGFDTYTKESDGNKYKFMHEYNKKEGFQKLFHSTLASNGEHVLYAPGMMYLIGYKYLVLRCPEIEQHLYRSLSYSKESLGLAKIRINSYGYNDEKTSFLKVPVREFHPIGKLSRISLKFETDTGELYDFKGVNHNIVFAIYYYEPKQENVVKSSILNPEYDPDFVNYMYKHDEQEGESDEDDEDDEDFSRDNIEIYKKRELEFNKKGIENRNKMIAYNNMKMLQAKEPAKKESLTKYNPIISESEDETESD